MKHHMLEKHLGYWLRAVSNQVSSAFAKRLEKFKINVAEWVVLNLLQEHITLSPADIAQQINMTRGAASKLIDSLCKKKLVSRLTCERDRRYQEISLTKQGKDLLPELRKEAEANEKAFFKHLSPLQQEEVINTLKGIMDLINCKDIPIN